MNILLLGATGATGKELLKQSLDAGHMVTVLVRTPTKITEDTTNLRIFTGDATDEKTVESAMAGNDVLISTLGSMKLNPSLMTKSSKAIAAGAKHTGIKRIIIMSSFLVRQNQLKTTLKLLTGMAMKNVIGDKQAGEELIRSSGIDWTIVYATPLTNKTDMHTTRVLPLNEKIGLSNSIARSEVAAWILEELANKTYLNKDVLISR